MRFTLFLCLLLNLFLESYQCLANESSHEEVYPEGKGYNVSKGDDGKGEGDSEQLDAVERLRHTLRAGKGGRSMGGGNAQVVRHPPSERKSSAPPYASLLSPWLVSMCVLASLVFF